MKSAEQNAKYAERISAADIATIPFTLNDGSQAQLDVYGVQPEDGSAEVPTIIIPGFTEGITQDAKFASHLCSATNDAVFVIGQYEREDKKFLGPKNALENQALAVLAFIEQIELQNSSVNIFANSLGAAVFARAAELAAEREWTCFTKESSHVVFMAPAGLKQDDNWAKVGVRFALDGGLNAHVKEEHGWDKDSLDAGQVLIKADPKKAAGEGLAASTAKIDFANLKDLGIVPDVMTSPKDGVMGQKALGESVVKLLEDGSIASWSTPFDAALTTPSPIRDEKAEGISKKERKLIAATKFTLSANESAEHNTHMVNDAQAKRTAKAVANIFNSK